jgi:hypothetical protein
LHKECLLRIAQDERMREAYGLLTTQFTKDQNWHKLLWAATTASLDFSRYRIQLSKASALCRKIDDGCKHLASLLTELRTLDVRVPVFDSICMLGDKSFDKFLQRPPNNLCNGVESLLNDLAVEACTTASEIENRKHDTGNELAWTVGDIEYDNPQNTFIMSALKTRQNNRKTDYLRAFACALTLEDHNALTPPVQKAMAVVGTVVINHPDIVVTYDDVRDLLGKGTLKAKRRSKKRKAKGKSRKKSRASLPRSRKTDRSKAD